MASCDSQRKSQPDRVDESHEVGSILRARVAVAVKAITILLVTITAGTNLIHFNLISPLHVLERKGVASWKSVYLGMFAPFFRIGSTIGLHQEWRMFSPSWKKAIWMEYNAIYADGKIVSWDVPNFSAEHRAGRTWVDKWFRGYKDPVIQTEATTREECRWAFARSICLESEARLGTRPFHIQIVEYQKSIPDPRSGVPFRSVSSVQRLERGRYACDQ